MNQKLTLEEAALSSALLDSGLNPYQGPWDKEQAIHLLRRCTFAPTRANVNSFTQQGLDACLDQLFAPVELPSPPVYYTIDTDPYAGMGETWVEATLPDFTVQSGRRKSLRAWTLGLLINEGVSIREKLTLFWHNHFAVGNIGDPRFQYMHGNLIRSYAWGNFRDLVKAVTIDPSMLRFLNGNQNTKNAPNENYARELLELFTIGKGPIAGPGDYTFYTEQDVVEMAKVLTGWKDQGHNSTNPEIEMSSYFRPEQHDNSVKTLSHRFNNQEIGDMGENEYAHLVDLIFEKEEVARFICRKLYRWFVYYKIDGNIESNVIEPMAQILIDNEYEIEPALRALLGSEHFFDILSMGPMIKNPIDFVVTLLNQFEIEINDTMEIQYATWHQQFNKIKLMDMEYYQPPNVAGWKAYYQEPLFYRNWINASTLPQRMAYTDKMANNGYSISGERIKIEPLKMVNTFDNPYDPNEVISEFTQLLFPQPLTDGQLASLKEVLLPGLPDFEWTVEYGDYAANPDDQDLSDAVENKLQDLIKVMLSMPEYYLS